MTIEVNKSKGYLFYSANGEESCGRAFLAATYKMHVCTRKYFTYLNICGIKNVYYQVVIGQGTPLFSVPVTKVAMSYNLGRRPQGGPRQWKDTQSKTRMG